MIELHNLQKTFGSTRALDGISLKVVEGELFAYLGPNGSGKTTTVRILSGLCRPDSGWAAVGGHDVVREAVNAKLLTGLVSQHLNLDPDLSLRENLDVHGRLYRLSAAERRHRSAELLAAVELEEKAGALVRTLSGGQKRRLQIARALLHQPRVLFLDEPTVGLDPAIRRRLWAMIKQIQQRGTTIFLTTHYIEEAEFLADRVAFLDRGRRVRLDTPQALMDDLGRWALDALDGGELATRFFGRREEAQTALNEGRQGFTLRRVNLEDAFLAATGRKVAA